MSNVTGDNGVTCEFLLHGFGSGTWRPLARERDTVQTASDELMPSLPVSHGHRGDPSIRLLSTCGYPSVSGHDILVHARSARDDTYSSPCSPITVGTIAIIVLFVYLRLSSNRVVAPMTLFDWLLNVALGSTLAGIVNGTSLTRGLLSLTTLMAFQLLAWVTPSVTTPRPDWSRRTPCLLADRSHSSQMSSHYGLTLERALNSPPLVIAFRGKALRDVMRKHRISQTDLNSALRRENIWNIRQVEAVIIEPTGMFSIYKRDTKPDGLEPEVLMDVPGYRRLVEHFDQDEGGRGGGQEGGKGRKGGQGGEGEEGGSGFSRDSAGDEGSGGDEEAAVRGVQDRRERGGQDRRAGAKGEQARKDGRGHGDQDKSQGHTRVSERKDTDEEEEKQGGQGGDGPTTGSEREANDIAQSAA